MRATMPARPSLAEWRAILAAARAGAVAGGSAAPEDDLLLDIQFRRPAGPRRMRMPGGGEREASIPEQYRLYRFERALNRIRAAEPSNPELTFMMEPGTLPSEGQVIRLEHEAGMAEARAAGGPAPAGPVDTLPGVPRPTYDIVMPNGRPVGMPFRNSSSGVQTVFQTEFDRIRAQLLQGATEIGREGYRGRWFRREDGTEFGFRDSPQSGATIDVHDPRLEEDFRIHIQ